MKYLVLIAALTLAGCTIGTSLDCTVTVKDGYGGTKTLTVFAIRGHGTLTEYKVNGAYTGGWISDRTILSTTCNKD
ncbi:hypothetical protein DT57C_000052 [Escherichia phage DT57C]|uniref:Uncharacterized protein n=3 Tax=Tequintavirus TaxID=187218 RepID=A0A0A7RZG8_9CAUD|nr:Cor superinfection exclusion protein [Escherichia phage DT57C]YP_009784902.1 Cor superinfection exclusion protein [Escherichia phage DT571/2]YP_009802223.1 Cor superinfection exclusion protein [Escherichia phage Gostya9]AJA41572.1 hypothetical protein DT57C_000052 [Escherichia phage DT57C]AJA41703.1 hypothetical protein DT5712_000050 [Escherichia phage DT571/2]AWN08713.1 hypothetical protein T59_00056c [Escherichia phage Gostya9]